MNPIFSIIVPVYNTAPYLRQCLDSILAQTFEDWECILVDDGSTDGSGAICDEYDRLDERFQVVHIANGGVSKARNLGIERATGKWIAFVDSDDTLLPSCFQHLMSRVNDDTEIVIAGYGGERGTHIINEDIFLEGNLMRRYFIEKKIYSQSGPCQKLFCTGVIKKNNIQFPMDIHMGEDMIFFIRYMNHVNSAELVTSDEYLVRSHEDSLSTKYYSYESERKCFDLWMGEIQRFVADIPWTESQKEAAVWRSRSLDTFLRTMECLYKANGEIPFGHKIKLLHHIDKQEIKNFLHYYEPAKSSSKVMKSLIRYRLFAFFLLAGNMHYKYFSKV